MKQIMTGGVRSFGLHWRNGLSLQAKLDLRPTLSEVRQEQMIRSMQLPYSAYATAFSQTDLLLIDLSFGERKAVPVQ